MESKFKLQVYNHRWLPTRHTYDDILLASEDCEAYAYENKCHARIVCTKTARVKCTADFTPPPIDEDAEPANRVNWLLMGSKLLILVWYTLFVAMVGRASMVWSVQRATTINRIDSDIRDAVVELLK